jgi:hypothetical protein
MPAFNTAAAAQQWCAQHFPVTPIKSFHMSTLELIGVGAVAIYFIGRIGLPTLWSDIQSGYSWVKGLFTTTTTAPVVTTPVVTETPAA